MKFLIYFFLVLVSSSLLGCFESFFTKTYVDPVKSDKKIDYSDVSISSFLIKPDLTQNQNFFSIGDLKNDRMFKISGNNLAEKTLKYQISLYSNSQIFYASTNNLTFSQGQDEIFFGMDINYLTWKNISDFNSIAFKILISDPEGTTNFYSNSLNLTKTPSTNIYYWRDLQAMEWDKSLNYQLQNDIEFPEPGTKGFPYYGFIPIGYQTITQAGEPFTGTLDGNHKNIRNFYINAPLLSATPISTLTEENVDISSKYIGLLSFVSNRDPFTVKNITIEINNRIKTQLGEVSGILAGVVKVGNLKQITVKGGEVSGFHRIGGLVGQIGEGKITGINHNNITTENRPNGELSEVVGGLVGIIFNFHTNHNLIKVSGTNYGAISSRGGRAGGLIGGMGGSGGVVNGYNHGNVNILETITTPGMADDGGGLIGQMDAGILNGINTGNVIGMGYGIGGLVGHLYGGEVYGITHKHTISANYAGEIIGLYGGSSSSEPDKIYGYWNQLNHQTTMDTQLSGISITYGTNLLSDRKEISNIAHLERRGTFGNYSYYQGDGNSATIDGNEVFKNFNFFVSNTTPSENWEWIGNGQFPAVRMFGNPED